MAGCMMRHSRKITAANRAQLPQRRCFAAVVITPLKGGINDECRTHQAPELTAALDRPTAAAGGDELNKP